MTEHLASLYAVDDFKFSDEKINFVEKTRSHFKTIRFQQISPPKKSCFGARKVVMQI